MSAAELRALAERVVRLEGPCRETDVRIALATGSGCVERFVKSQNGDWLRDGSNASAYTASLDAAMTLVPEGWSVLTAFGPRGAVCDISPEGLGGNGAWPAHARAATPALALTAAAIRALGVGLQMTAMRVAASLTKAQREALLPNDKGWADCHKGKAWSRSVTTARRLYALGLTETENNLSPVTPLGLQVRNILKGQADGE